VYAVGACPQSAKGELLARHAFFSAALAIPNIATRISKDCNPDAQMEITLNLFFGCSE
jgi:hypothetical protein